MMRIKHLKRDRKPLEKAKIERVGYRVARCYHQGQGCTQSTRYTAHSLRLRLKEEKKKKIRVKCLASEKYKNKNK